MLLTIATDLRLVVEQPLSSQPLAAIEVTRGTSVPVTVQFVRNGSTYDPTYTQTSGTLTIGRWCKITAFVSGDVFTNVGAGSNATGQYFKATGTTPTTWTNGSTLQRCSSAGTLFGLIWAVKEDGEFDAAPLVLASGSDFTTIGSGSTVQFEAQCNYYTEALNALLGVGAGTDVDEVALMGEISWIGPEANKARKIVHAFENDVYHGDADVVASANAPQSIHFVTTSVESTLAASHVITGSSTITVTVATGLVTLTLPSDAALPGNPTAATQTAGNNTTRIATTAFVTAALAAVSSGLTVGSTTIASGTATRILYDNSGVLGEYTISGTGSVAMTVSPSFTTPTLGAATATTINGNTLTTGTGTLTLSTFTLTVTGTASISGTHTGTHSGTSSGTNTGDQTITLTGDATGSGTGSFAATLATVNTTTGTFGDATHYATFAVNGKGLVTVSSQTVWPTFNQDTSGNAATATLAATVTTNANLTGPITSVGNATSIASQTGTGTKFVVDTSPTLVTPILGVAAGTSINFTTSSGSNNAITLSNSSTTSNVAVGQFYPTSGTNVSPYFIVAPKGNGSSNILLYSTDTLGSSLPTNYEYVTLTSVHSGSSYLACAKGGTGSARGFFFQFDGSSTTTNCNLYLAPSGGVAVGGVSDAGINNLSVVGSITGATIVATAATSLLLGTAGSTVGSVGFRNATSGTITVSPPTGALGTVAIVLPSSAGTIALTTDITGGTLAGSFTTITGTSSLTLGVASTTAGTIVLKNATSTGTTTISGANVSSSSYTWTVPAATDTAVGKATTDVLTNKSIDAGQLTGSIVDARNTVSNTTTTSLANLVTVGTLTGGATGAGFTVALTTSTITGTLAAARGGTGVSNTGTITLAGNLVTTGAFNTTLAQAATTTVTLPSTSSTMARTDAAQTFTGAQAFTSAIDVRAGGLTSTTANTCTLVTLNGTALTYTLNNITIGSISGTACTLGFNGQVTLVSSRQGSLDSDAMLSCSAYSTTGGGIAFSMRKSTALASNAAGYAMIGVKSVSSVANVFAKDESGNETQLSGNASFPLTLAVTGATTLTGNLTSNGALITTPEALAPALNAGAAVGVTTLTSTIAVNGVNAVTLANGTNGQIKTVVCTAVTAAGTATVTPTAANGYTTFAFTAAGQSVTAQYFTTGGWAILSVRGATVA